MTGGEIVLAKRRATDQQKKVTDLSFSILIALAIELRRCQSVIKSQIKVLAVKTYYDGVRQC